MILGHAEECQVTRERVELLSDIAKKKQEVPVPAANPDFWALIGAALEYFNDGDQELENCTCDGPWMLDGQPSNARLPIVDAPSQFPHSH